MSKDRFRQCCICCNFADDEDDGYKGSTCWQCEGKYAPALIMAHLAFQAGASRDYAVLTTAGEEIEFRSCQLNGGNKIVLYGVPSVRDGQVGVYLPHVVAVWEASITKHNELTRARTTKRRLAKLCRQVDQERPGLSGKRKGK